MKLLANLDRALTSNRSRETQRTTADPVGERADLASAIGERYEVLTGGLDRITDLLQQLRGLEPVVSEMRGPLLAEYDARRSDYIELMNLRTTHGEVLARGEALMGEVRTLDAARSAIEQQLEEATQQLSDRSGEIQDLQLEIDRLTTAQAQAQAQIQTLSEAETISGQRQRQLEQDLETVTSQLQDADTGRAEAVSGRSLALRDHALASEENGALKKRLDEALAEVSRLARMEATQESQLTAERARATSDQVESARAVQNLEAQVENGRSEIAALQVRLDTLTARADRLERLNADLSASLNEAQTSSQAAERRASQLQTDLNRATERLRDHETQVEDGRQRLTAMDAARLAAVDRADHLSKSATANERALARSEARAGKLQATIDGLKADAETRRRELNEQLESLRSRLEGAQAESAMTAAALDTARRERSTVAANG
ncbi:MAG TPA: hypothetical protein PLE81_01680 [Brevundimonas sp.]|uniref:hypothetical protein n=1 Tax=Brevundimonas sp. TaxID=1871086 RepID=UPI002B5BCE6A|nr:hypothetical protein [Brevundimonas sp.]HRH19326.1 hypothetical protein [Brevundimonas sp.]